MDKDKIIQELQKENEQLKEDVMKLTCKVNATEADIRRMNAIGKKYEQVW